MWWRSGMIARAGRIRARASVVDSVQAHAGVLVVGGYPVFEEMCSRSLTFTHSVREEWEVAYLIKGFENAEKMAICEEAG